MAVGRVERHGGAAALGDTDARIHRLQLPVEPRLRSASLDLTVPLHLVHQTQTGQRHVAVQQVREQSWLFAESASARITALEHGRAVPGRTGERTGADQLDRGAYPEGVARVSGLVGPTVITASLGPDAPVQQRVEALVVLQRAQQRQRGHAQICAAAVTLAVGYQREAAVIALALGDEGQRAAHIDAAPVPEQCADGTGAVHEAHVSLAAAVCRPKGPAALILQTGQRANDRAAVDAREIVASDDERGERGVCRRQAGLVQGVLGRAAERRWRGEQGHGLQTHGRCERRRSWQRCGAGRGGAVRLTQFAGDPRNPHRLQSPSAPGNTWCAYIKSINRLSMAACRSKSRPASEKYSSVMRFVSIEPYAAGSTLRW